MAYELEWITLPSKKLLFQTVNNPSEAPAEGEKANLSRYLGENFLR
jgi:hypothetical protein